MWTPSGDANFIEINKKTQSLETLKQNISDVKKDLQYKSFKSQ